MFRMIRATASTMWSPSERLCNNMLRRHLPWVHHHQLSLTTFPNRICEVWQTVMSCAFDDSRHETDFREAWRNIDDSASVSTSFELVFFSLSHTTTCCCSLHFWTVYGQVFFCSGTADTASHNMVTTSALRNSRTGTFAHWRFSCSTGWTFSSSTGNRSRMQTGAWKSQYGSPNNHCYDQQDLWLFFSFSPKISEATIMTFGEERLFSVASLNRTIDAPWDSSATWTPSATNSTMGGLPFLSRNNCWCTAAL